MCISALAMAQLNYVKNVTWNRQEPCLKWPGASWSVGTGRGTVWGFGVHHSYGPLREMALLSGSHWGFSTNENSIMNSLSHSQGRARPLIPCKQTCHPSLLHVNAVSTFCKVATLHTMWWRHSRWAVYHRFRKKIYWYKIKLSWNLSDLSVSLHFVTNFI